MTSKVGFEVLAARVNNGYAAPIATPFKVATDAWRYVRAINAGETRCEFPVDIEKCEVLMIRDNANGLIQVAAVREAK